MLPDSFNQVTVGTSLFDPGTIRQLLFLRRFREPNPQIAVVEKSRHFAS